MNNKILSIVVPTYNNENTIESCLNSIENNFLKCSEKIELIVINDGSSDSTFEKIYKFSLKKNNIKIINQKNTGVSLARNAGIENASGKYIWFIDGDDRLADFNGVQLLNTLIQKNADLYLVGFKKIVYYNNTFKTTEIKNSSQKLYQKKDISKEFLKVFCENEFNVPWNKIYRLKTIKYNEIKFVPNMVSGEDASFNCDYFTVCDSLFTINKVINIYHIKKYYNLKYNDTYYKDVRIMIDKMGRMVKKINLDSSFLDNKYVETEKGIIDNIFIKYLNQKLNKKNITRDLRKECLGKKVNFFKLSNKNKLKYLVYTNKLSINLRFYLRKWRKQ